MVPAALLIQGDDAIGKYYSDYKAGRVSEGKAPDKHTLHCSSSV